MAETIAEGKTFKDVDYTGKAPGKGQYEDCAFSGCVFTNTDLSDIVFSECRFESCDLSMAKLRGTAFRTVRFINCKLLGLRFDDCNDFLLSLDFDGCILNFSSFYKRKLKGTTFKDCQLEEVEFIQADLTSAVFLNCNLSRAAFEETILEKADLRSASNFSIDPENNRLARARFSTHNIAGLLGKYNLIIE